MDTHEEAASPDQMDWRAAARAEYAHKRVELGKRVAAAAKAEEKAKKRREEAEAEMRDLEAGARAFGLTVDDAASQSVTAPEPSADGPSAKQIIVNALTMAYPNGVKAAQLRAIVERELGRPVHYKTAGMTLYRLKDAGEVERDGILWKLAAPPARFVVGHDAPLALHDDADDFEDLLDEDDGVPTWSYREKEDKPVSPFD